MADTKKPAESASKPKGFQPTQDEIEDWREESIGDLGQVDAADEAAMMSVNFPTFFLFDPEKNSNGRSIPIDEDTNIKAFPLMPGNKVGGRYAGPMRLYSDKFLNEKNVEVITNEDGSTTKKKFQDLHVFVDKAERVFGIWGTSSIDLNLQKMPSGAKVIIRYDGKMQHPTNPKQSIHKLDFMVEKDHFNALLRHKLAPGQTAKLGLATTEAPKEALPPAHGGNVSQP